MIYFVRRSDSTGPIKIGCTEDVKTRIVALRTAYGQPLVVLKTTEGSEADERETHERFRAYRIDKTEQFRPGPELTDHLGLPREAGWESVQPWIGRLADRTHPLQIRVTEDDRQKLARIRENYGLRTDADAIRLALHRLDRAVLVYRDEAGNLEWPQSESFSRQRVDIVL